MSLCWRTVQVFLFCLLSEHQAALLQLKRECKEDLERMHVSYHINLADMLQQHWLKAYYAPEKMTPGICEGKLL